MIENQAAQNVLAAFVSATIGLWEVCQNTHRHIEKESMVKMNFSADFFYKVQNNVVYFVMIKNTSAKGHYKILTLCR
jgi:hypothetical protein